MPEVLEVSGGVEDSVGSEDSVDPVGSEDSVNSEDSVDSAGSEDPVDSAGSEDPVDSAGSEDPVDSAGSEDPEDSVCLELSEESVEVTDGLLPELSSPSLLFAISSTEVPIAAMAITAQAITKILYFKGRGGDCLFRGKLTTSAVLGIAFTEEVRGRDIVRGKVFGE